MITDNKKDDCATMSWFELLDSLGICYCVFDGTKFDVVDFIREIQSAHPAFRTWIKRASAWLNYTDTSILGVVEFLNLFGDELLKQGLRLCGIKRATTIICWIQNFETPQEYFAFWKDNLTRRQFFDNVMTFSVKQTVPKATRVPLALIDDQKRVWCDEQDIEPCFFLHTDTKDCIVASYDWISTNSKTIEKKYRAFCINEFPKEFDTSLCCNHMMVEPYLLSIKDGDKTFAYTTDSIAKPKHWKPFNLCCLRKSDDEQNKEDLPSYMNCELFFSSESIALFADKSTNNVLKLNLKTKKITKLESSFFSAKALVKSTAMNICGDDFIICSCYSINNRDVDLLFLNVRTAEIYILAREEGEEQKSFKQILCWNENLFVIGANGIVYKLKSGQRLIDALKTTDSIIVKQTTIIEELGRTYTEYGQTKIVFSDVTSITQQ